MALQPVVLVAAALIVSGCYVRSAVRGPAPVPGTEVEVTLSRSDTTQATALGSNVHVLDGRVVASGPDTLALAVTRALDYGGAATQQWHGDRIALPHSAIEKVERRRLSVVRTGILVGGVVTGFVVAYETFKTGPTACGFPTTVNC